MPILSKLMDRVSKIIDWFSELNKKHRKKIVNWALLAAIGPGYISSRKFNVIYWINYFTHFKIDRDHRKRGLVPALGLLGTKVISVLAILLANWGCFSKCWAC